MIGTGYLLQTVLIVAWWLGVWSSDAVYEAFALPGVASEAFFAFLVPDVVLIAILSLIRAYRSVRDLELIILGAFGYAALFCLSAALVGGGGHLAAAVMSVGFAYNGFLCYHRRLFRVGTSERRWVLVLKTAIQVVCVWALTLILLPAIILHAAGASWIPEPGWPLLAGAIGFVGASALARIAHTFLEIRDKWRSALNLPK